MAAEFNNDWDDLLKDEFEKEYYLNLRKFLIDEYKTQKIHPSMYDIFNALKFTPYKDVKVVILGQDPIMDQTKLMDLAFLLTRSSNSSIFAKHV